MATIGNAPVFPTESVLPGDLEVTGNATISGSSATVNGNEVRTVGTSGAILQVVQASTTTEADIRTTTYTDTGLSASITPTSSSNKILVIINQTFQAYRASSNDGGGIRILRDSTVIYTPVTTSTGPLTFYSGGGGDTAQETFTNSVIHYLDSPSTTSSVTYKTQGRPYVTSNSSRMIFQYSISTTVDGRSDIILMEIVA
jgi:hypothetical protein